MLARRKLEAPPDAGHEPRDGETVRGNVLTIKSRRGFGSWVSARKLSIRRKAFSGFTRRALTGTSKCGPSTPKVNPRRSPVERVRTAHRSAQRPVGRAFE